MAAPRKGDGRQQGQKRAHYSRRRSVGSSPDRSPSRSPSPRTKRLRGAREEKELERNKDTDHNARNLDRDREMGRLMNRRREEEDVRMRSRERIRGRSTEQEKPRERKSSPSRGRRSPSPRDRRPSSPRDRRGFPSRDRRPSPPRDRKSSPPRGRRLSPREIRPSPPRDRGPSPPRDRKSSPPRARRPSPSRDRRPASPRDTSTPPRQRKPTSPRERRPSPVRPPVRSRHERSLSPEDVRHRRPPPPRSSPHRQRSSKHDQHMSAGTTAAARDEDVGDAGKGQGRDNEVTPQQDDAVSMMKEVEASLQAKEKERPSFEYSGKLAAETNKVKGVTLLFTEPPEARKPSTRWRLYVFKDGEPHNEPLYIHRQSCYLFGRERRVADVPTDHPSCSKQHAVIQYRLTEKEEPNGTTSNKIRPYVMDLGSTNGTFLNGDRLESERYYEMFEKDTIKFGNSSREYVLLHEHSTG